ncbi:hypothetical protein [Catalinimonas niigatensis]|uniref:hypothetical protein n=1 Tax=Catalinimonas niigatensis TaxID=1397264 RepID=UPI0026669535|nr:hypothetical protein [Catalinimonas niigatensis]WPP51751.1 hypothetical protein PZB72_05040 [Catalinimonas niigatensis]
MKIFIKRTLLFLLLAVVVIESLSIIMAITDLYLIGYPGNDIYYSIAKSKKKNKSKTLLIGDSVGRQLFPIKSNNHEINSLASNQAIGIVGQYLLLNNYLKAGNEIDELIMIFTPFSFQNNLDQKYTYHYFIKPFNNSEYSSLFTETVKEQIRKIPYHQFAQVPHIFVTPWAPEIDLVDQKDYTFLSPVSIEYLDKIKELSIQYDFELNVLPPPTSIEHKDEIKKMDVDEASKCDLEQEFKDYFNKITYLDSTKFYDGTHLIYPENYSARYRAELIE